MTGIALLLGFLGLGSLLLAWPLYVGQTRNVLRGSEFVPLNLIAAAFASAFGCALLGGMIWLLTIS